MSRHHPPRPGLRRLAWPAAAVATGLLLVAAATVAVIVIRPDPKSRGTASTSASSSATPSAPGSASPAVSPTASATPSASKSATPSKSPTKTAAAPTHFATRPPGAALPSGAQCAIWVQTKPYPENKGANKKANQTTGHHVGAGFFSGDAAAANTKIAPRVDGQFTGTTRQILRWAACKWGIDEDLVLAQAAIESWWQQGTTGDWTTDASRCAPGRGLGVDGTDGQCPESFGILQNRYPYEKSAWPGIARSTAMNADLAYGIWRTCFEGYETWLNTVERGQQYAAGDAWGCIGRWFSGRWHTAASDTYVGRVRNYLDQRIWETPNFQQPNG